MANYCEYCGTKLPEGCTLCPGCGAPVDSGGKNVPKTIDELRAFAAWHRLPLQDMRFFLGEDYPGPKAFGIFQAADGDFVVYKNKSDGSRAIRYKGPDEAHAVNELYLKMKAEVINQRRAQAGPAAKGRSTGSGKSASSGNKALLRPLVICLALAAAVTVFRTARALKNQNGYYHYNNNYYYSQQDDWYRYDDELDYWFPVTVEDELADNASDYYESSYYAGDYGVSDFSESEYYEESSSSWDDDWDWDSDSDWDSDYSDWDSDW